MKIEDVDNLQLITACILGEAAGENFLGKLSVACVIRNRKHDQRWPDTWHEVILQPKQFSCFNHLPASGEIPLIMKHQLFTHCWSEMWFKEARLAAWAVLNNFVNDITNSSNHYFAWKLIDVPSWAKGRDPVFVVGGHQFYKL